MQLITFTTTLTLAFLLSSTNAIDSIPVHVSPLSLTGKSWALTFYDTYNCVGSTANYTSVTGITMDSPIQIGAPVPEGAVCSYFEKNTGVTSDCTAPCQNPAQSVILEKGTSLEITNYRTTEVAFGEPEIGGRFMNFLDWGMVVSTSMTFKAKPE